MISVFMPSYNKGDYGKVAIQSVLDQSFQDWEMWILENSTDGTTRENLYNFLPEDSRFNFEAIDIPEEVRENHSPAPWLANKYYPKAEGDIILYISDDDLFAPGLFQAVADHFADNPDHEAVYFELCTHSVTGPFDGTNWVSNTPRMIGPRDASQVDCQIDGGQVAYRKRVLGKIGQPYFYDGLAAEASHCDGVHLQKVASVVGAFQPLCVPGVIHRITPLSTWTYNR